MHPTNSELTATLHSLNQIKSNAEAGLFDDIDTGICHTLCETLYEKLVDVKEERRYRLSFELRDWAMKHSLSWSKYSGCSAYPVPKQYPELRAAVSYRYTALYKEMWKGDQLSLRIDLLNHLIQSVTKELDNATH